MATPVTWIEAPARASRPNTSLDILPVHDVTDEHFVGYEFIPDPCAFPNPLPQNCYVTLGPTAGTPKTFGDAGDALVTKVFGAYQGVECFLNGGIDEFRDVARRVLENGEHRVVDGQLAAALAAAATATTPATATSAAQAIGLLEQVLAGQVPGQGYIYLSPLAATYAAAAGLIRPPGLNGDIYTYLGTPIIVLTEPSMALVAYASGPVNIWRTPINVIDAPNVTKNLGRAIAERLYSLAIECGVWKVTIPAPAATGQPTDPDEDLAMTLGSIPSSPIPDGTDTTIVVQTNVTPQNEVWLHYSVNGGPDLTAGEMTQIDPHQFVWNVVGENTTTGDSVEVWAVSEWDGADVESNHIIIEVT